MKLPFGSLQLCRQRYTFELCRQRYIVELGRHRYTVELCRELNYVHRDIQLNFVDRDIRLNFVDRDIPVCRQCPVNKLPSKCKVILNNCGGTFRAWLDRCNHTTQEPLYYMTVHACSVGKKTGLEFARFCKTAVRISIAFAKGCCNAECAT